MASAEKLGPFLFLALNKNLEECAYYAAFWKQGFPLGA
jgi:hypothetical protein